MIKTDGVPPPCLDLSPAVLDCGREITIMEVEAD